MTPIQVNEWALDVIAQAQAGKHSEDSLVELKSIWIEPLKAAHRIAAQANSARSQDILWLIGVDENTGIVIGADKKELANWWPAVQKFFDGETPHLMYNLNLTVDGKSVIALVFSTELAPYVSITPGLGLIDRTILVREANRTRAAKRSEILKLLVPLIKLPDVEIISGNLFITVVHHHDGSQNFWKLQLTLYIEPKSDSDLNIPTHRCTGFLEVESTISPLALKSVEFEHQIKDNTSATIFASEYELLVQGSGRFKLIGKFYSPENAPLPTEKNIRFIINLLPSGLDSVISLTGLLVPHSVSSQDKSAYWIYKKP